jgi:hypothetical protein
MNKEERKAILGFVDAVVDYVISQGDNYQKLELAVQQLKELAKTLRETD